MKTAVSNAQDRRQEIRYGLFGELPARLVNLSTEQELTFLTIDISQRGLGLLVSPGPAEGQSIRLDFVDQKQLRLQFVCRHVHTMMDDTVHGFESMRRCGLELADEQKANCDLIELFARFESVMIGD